MPSPIHICQGFLSPAAERQVKRIEGLQHHQGANNCRNDDLQANEKTVPAARFRIPLPEDEHMHLDLTCHCGLAMARTTPGKPPPDPTSITLIGRPLALLACWSKTGSRARQSWMCRSIAWSLSLIAASAYRFRTRSAHRTILTDFNHSLIGQSVCHLLSAHPVDCDAQQLVLGIVTYLLGLYAC